MRVAGRVLARRDMGKLVFLDLVDRSGRIQLFCQEDRAGVVDVDLGDIVGASGSPMKTKRGEPSLAVDELVLLGKIRRPLPDTFHGLKDTELRYRQRYVDLLMSEETREAFVKRTQVITAIRRYLDEEGFVEVETPVLQPRYGGAFAHPFVTHHNELDADLYLRIATELYLKRLIVGGLERVYEIGKDFRNEGVSYKHQPEFTMLEWYEAYADYTDTMARIETLLERVATEVTGGTKVTFRGHEIDLKAPWKRLGFVESLETARALDTRCRRAARVAHRAWRRHGGRQGLDAARRPRVRPLRGAVARRADDRPRLSGRALAVRAHDGRRPVAHASGSSTSPPAWSWATPTRRSPTPTSSSSGSTSSPSTSRVFAETPTTSRRCRMGCRRPAGSVSASTG